MLTCSQKRAACDTPEYFEDERGNRVEVRKELRTEAAAVRRDVAIWTGTQPAAVPIDWPSACHLFEAQANASRGEAGIGPVYAWGTVIEDGEAAEGCIHVQPL